MQRIFYSSFSDKKDLLQKGSDHQWHDPPNGTGAHYYNSWVKHKTEMNIVSTYSNLVFVSKTTNFDSFGSDHMSFAPSKTKIDISKTK